MSVLEKAGELIDCLGRAGEPVTLGHVRAALDMPKSSAHRLLGELASLGIVRRTEGGLYSLGPRLLYWGEAAAETFDLRSLAEGPMRRLRDELGESVHLYIREGDARICIAAVEGHHELRPFIQLGRRIPLRLGAAGKLLLAFADESVRQSELQHAVDEAAGLPNAPGPLLAEQLERIRVGGVATSIGDRPRRRRLEGSCGGGGEHLGSDDTGGVRRVRGAPVTAPGVCASDQCAAQWAALSRRVFT